MYIIYVIMYIHSLIYFFQSLYVAEVSNGFMLSLVPLSNESVHVYINARYVHGIPIGYRLFEASKEYLNKYKASFCLFYIYKILKRQSNNVTSSLKNALSICKYTDKALANKIY